MAVPRAVRCNLCNTKICTLIIFCKLIFTYLWDNEYSKRWERSLPHQQRIEQRRKRNNIYFYQSLAITPALLPVIMSLWFPVGSYGTRNIINMVISLISSIVYISSFWYVTYGQEEFKVISRAWHSGRNRELYSKIRMPEHVKLVVVIILIAELASWCLLREDVAWFLVTVLKLSSWYFFLDPNFAKLFPRNKNNGQNELVYVIE